MNNGTFGVCLGRNGGNPSYSKFINCEFYETDATPNNYTVWVYIGGGNTCNSGNGGAQETYFINNVFNNAGAAGIESNPRNATAGVYIYGNAFHNVGHESCGTEWKCRPPIILDGPSCSGTTTDVLITDNIMWDIGGGGIWERTGESAEEILIYNNTIYDYGKGADGDRNGITGYTGANGVAALTNNIVMYSSGSHPPFDATGFTKTNNMCLTGETCGDNSQTESLANTFESTNEDSSNFLKLKSGANAIDNGSASGVTTSYFGDTWVEPYDIGADQYGDTSTTVFKGCTPTGLVINQ